MKSVVVRAAFVILTSWATAPTSPAAPHPIVDRVYHCTLIARAEDLAPLGVNGMPSINGHGQVAFATRGPSIDDDSEVRVGYGDAVNGVPRTRRIARGSSSGSAPFLSVGSASIDNSGRITYFAEGFLSSFLSKGIFRVPYSAYDGVVPTPLIETRESNPASPFVGILDLPIAGTNSVLFSASYFVSGAPPQLTGLFQNDVLTLAGPTEEYAYDAGPSGAYAFRRGEGTYPNEVSRLYLGTQPIDSVPVATGLISGLSAATNVSGSVSYGRFEGAGFEVRVWAGTPRVYVDSDDDALFAFGDATGDIQTSINAYGKVALVAGDDSFAFRRVFMADGDLIHRVLCENDGIFTANIGARAINAAGQIAFVGVDGNGQGVIARADPLPGQGLPASCSGLSVGSACDDGDPETAAVCTSGGQCVGDSIERPTSCQFEQNDTPCDDGHPATLAFCEGAQCVPVPLTVPEPAVPASIAAAVAALATCRRSPRRRARSRLPLLGLASGLAIASAGPAAAARAVVDRSYDCKIIASSLQFPLGVDWLGPPAMNAWGQVVFRAVTAVDGDSVAELRVGRGAQSNGVPITHLAASGGENASGPSDPPAPFASVEEGAIDGAGRVTFLARRQWWTGGGEAIYRSDPGTGNVNLQYATKDVDSSSPFLAFDLLDTLGVSAAGSIVFQGVHETIDTAYYRNGAVVAQDFSNGVQIVNPPVLLHAGQPWTAFKASLLGGGGGEGIWVNGARWVASVNGQGGFAGLSLSGNASPVIAYSRSGFSGIDSWELVVTGALGTSVFVDADVDPFSSSADPLQTSINVWSEVAFISTPNGFGKSLLVADGGQQIRRVVCQNQLQTFGGLFTDLTLSPHGLNADGQIAFRGRNFLATYLVRADPLPGQGAAPTSCVGLSEGARCDDGDPITQSSCQANLCQGNPLVDPPTSCVGVEDDAACNDGDRTTVSTCDGGECVGVPLPTPEPSSTWPAFVAAAAIASLRRPR